jgi:hypothetical protein
MTPPQKKIFFFFFAYEYQQYTEFYADLKSVEIIGKSTPEKVIFQQLYQVSSIQ